MKDTVIPIRAVTPMTGAGSQPADEADLSYVPIPRDVEPFAMPRLPETAPAGHMRAASDLLRTFLRNLDEGIVRMDLARADAGGLKVLNETLGEGEVGIRIDPAAPDAPRVHIQETVFAGIWREQHVDPSGRLLHDWLSACAIPDIAIDFADAAASPTLAPVTPMPGAMNTPALLTEIRERVRRHASRASAHVINLTLLPLTPEDHQMLEQALPVGPVSILSRGFGNCRITSTGVRHLWRVQYFNSMQTLILNTMEIVRVPEVAVAAEDDLRDSRDRLQQLLEWMSDASTAEA